MCMFTIQDENTLSGKHDEEPVLYTFDYHIVYSRSYSVPVLYFNVYKPGNNPIVLVCMLLLAMVGAGTRLIDTSIWIYMTYANDYCITLYFRGRKISRKVNLKYFREKIFSRIYCSRENIFPRKYLPAKIFSRENIFPRKYLPAKIVCLFRQRSFLFAVCCAPGDRGHR